MLLSFKLEGILCWCTFNLLVLDLVLDKMTFSFKTNIFTFTASRYLHQFSGYQPKEGKCDHGYRF